MTPCARYERKRLLMKRRTVALLLSLVLAVCCLSGCTSTRVRSSTGESGNAASDKYAAAVNAYGSNKKVMTVNGSPVYWNEYAYFLCAILANMSATVCRSRTGAPSMTRAARAPTQTS